MLNLIYLFVIQFKASANNNSKNFKFRLVKVLHQVFKCYIIFPITP